MKRISNGSTSYLYVENEKESSFIGAFGGSYGVYGLLGALIVAVLTIIALSVTLCIRKKRPRIKKRIIVNPNVRPLTYRPQPPEQCEITIENCCNMNVCETVSEFHYFVKALNFKFVFLAMF